MKEYEQNLHINDTAFDAMRMDADRVLQRLIKNMVEKDSMEGKVTITIDVAFTQEFIPNRDPNIEGETRRILTPKFSHKVGSVMQIKNEVKGGTNYDGMELVWDEVEGEYVLKPVANTEQMTIFDADYQCVNDVEEEDAMYEQPALEGKCVVALPGPTDEEDEENLEEEENEESDAYSEGLESSVADMSEAFEEDSIPFLGGDEYGYEEPGEF